jgi:site-specific DNA-methyltransferase (adenine-specific)
MKVIEGWGFTYKTIGFVWTKINPGRARESRRHLITHLYSRGLIGFLDWLRFFGVGHYAKSNTEICLLATRGPYMEPATNTVSSVVFAPRGRHSAKPHEVHRRIEQMYPLDKHSHIELFAREMRPGWTVRGLEIDGADIEIALKDFVT